MQPILVYLLLSALACGLAVWLLHARKEQQARRNAARLEQEHLDAYRKLHVRLDFRLEQGRFSYRPATGELVLDPRAAEMHGVAAAPPVQAAGVTVEGWQNLPATARAAGWIDDALKDGLAQRQPVRCEYLARTAGQADRHLILTAVPLSSGGVLVGAVAQRPKGGYVGAPPWQEGPVAEPPPASGRFWAPGPRARNPS